MRVGGKYKLVFSANGSTMEFLGTCTEVAPPETLDQLEELLTTLVPNAA